MAFLWLPLAHNIFFIQAFGSSVSLAMGLKCIITEGIQEVQGTSAGHTSYSFEAEAAVEGFRTGSVTFIVPSETPEFPSSKYNAAFDEAQCAWIVYIQKSSRATLTFPTIDIFPNFSPSPSALVDTRLSQLQHLGYSTPSLLITQIPEDDSLEAEPNETESVVASEASDLQSTSPITDDSLSQVEKVEEMEEGRDLTLSKDVGKSWAEEMDEEDESSPTPDNRPLPIIVEEPEPPEVSTMEIYEQDRIEPVGHEDNTTTAKIPERDDDMEIYMVRFREMIEELRDPRNPNLSTFISKNLTGAYNQCYEECLPLNPKLDPKSWEYEMLCRDNARWRWMHFASKRINEEHRLRRPLLEESECEKKRVNTGPFITHQHPACSRPNPYQPDDETHHRNMLGRCVNTRSTTPIEISFWATHSPALANKFQAESPLLHRVCASRAATWVDPFHINSHIDLWNGSEWVTGSASLAQVKGRVDRVYLYNDLWRSPEDALGRSEVPHCVDFWQVPVKPISPPIVDHKSTEFADMVVNDDGQFHLPNKSTRKEQSEYTPSNLRNMKLCYEDAELSTLQKGRAEEELASAVQEIAEIMMHKPGSPHHEDEAESVTPIIAPARLLARRKLQPVSARLVRRATPTPLPIIRAQISNHDEADDDDSDAETEIIVDYDEPKPPSRFIFTCPDELAPSNHVQAGAHVSEWLEVLANPNSLNDDALRPSHAGESPVETEALDTTIEDEFLRRLAAESPQDIITTDDDDSGHYFSFDEDEYNPIMQVLESPVTDSSTLNKGSSEDEHEHGRDSPASSIIEVESDLTETREQTDDATDLIVYNRPILFEQGVSVAYQEFHILSPVLTHFLTPKKLFLPMQVSSCHVRPSTALVLYSPPSSSCQEGSEAITRKPRLDERTNRISRVFCSGSLSFGRQSIKIEPESNKRLAQPVLQNVTATVGAGTSAPELSHGTTIIHEVDLSSIPIIPFNDVSEIPEPSPSKPERFYGKINIAIGKAAIKAWKFLTPASKDWNINAGSAGEDDGYMWDRQSSPWGAFQFA